MFARHYEARQLKASMRPFFRSAETLVKNQFLHILSESLNDYVKMIRPNHVCSGHNIGFVLRLWLNNIEGQRVIEFEPPLSEIENGIMEGISYISKTIEVLPHIEDVLRSESVKELLNPHSAKQSEESNVKTIMSIINYGFGENDIHVALGPSDIADTVAEMKEFISACFNDVTSYLKVYEKYQPLLSNDIDKEIEAYNNEDHTFEDYAEKIDSYRRIIDEITTQNPRVALPMFEMYCEDLHRSLSNRVMEVSYLYLSKIIELTSTHQRTICKRYEEIEKKTQEIPENFKELADLMAYLEFVKNTELPAIVDELEIAKKRFNYIVHYSALTEDYIQLNNVTFTWPRHIIPVIEAFEAMIEEHKDKFQSSLVERRVKYEEELAEMAKQVDELKEVGDIDEMPFYVKKVQGLHKQLQAGMDTIANINKEEQLYKWPVTAYPLRKQILSTLEPFQALYQTVVNFQKSFKKWMDGSFQELDAEQIEAEIDAAKREINRLSTVIVSSAPQNIMKQINVRIEEIMSNIELIRAICNPGLRERHWIKMSEMSALNLKPDSSTTLRKMLKMDLNPFLDKFKDISGTLYLSFLLF